MMSPNWWHNFLLGLLEFCAAEADRSNFLMEVSFQSCLVSLGIPQNLSVQAPLQESQAGLRGDGDGQDRSG